MSNICIIGHISIDKIYNNKNIHESIGGPPCYSGITCIKEGHNIEVLTKVGKNFPDEYESWLKDKNIEIKNQKSYKETTSFEIKEIKNNKHLRLINQCEEIIPKKTELDNYDGIIISPIANELNKKNNSIINKLDNTTMLDPQGYIREFDKEGFCNFKHIRINELPKTDIIKISEEESMMLDKSTRMLDRLKKIAETYPITIGTIGNNSTYLINNKICYVIKNNKSDNLRDTIGLGDILNGMFFSMYLKEEDILWSISKSIAFASTRTGIGIKKLEVEIEYNELVDHIYNNIKRID
tara:strand:+ start:253 stop:1140 length:888 start_codon:yes stop_codon:yes gene_type:complete